MNAMLTAPALAERLSSLLDSMLGAYERMEAAGESHRAAIRTSDPRAMDAAVARQTVIFREISGLDQKRRELVAHAHASFPALRHFSPERTTLTQLAALAPDTVRAHLTGKADALRNTVRRVHEQNSSIRGAAVSLMAHMEGVMRQVARQLSHTGTYSRRGVVEAGGSVVTALDLRS